MRQTHRHSIPAARRGAILVLMTFVLPAVLILCFMGVNTAYMLLLRTELRVATDAAARAAGSTFSFTDNETTATDAAKMIALANKVGGQGLVLADTDVEFGESTQPTPGAKYQFSVGGIRKNSARVSSALTSRDLFASGLFDATTFSPTQTATATYANVDICLVLDRSSSMKLYTWETASLLPAGDPRECQAPHADSRWQALESAVDAFVVVMNNTIPVEHVSVVTYGSDYTQTCSYNPAAEVDSSLSGNLNNVTSAMALRSSTVWGGMTEIHAGIALGTSVLTGPSSRSSARKIMIVLTDGHYTAGDPVPFAATAAGQGIRVHAVTFGDGANQSDMQDVATAGGGSFFHAPDPSTLEAVFRKLAAMPVLITD